MKQTIRLSLIVLAASVRPFLTLAAEPPELDKGIAAAGSGKIEDAAVLLAKAVDQGSDQARWLLARLHGAGKMKGASLVKARELLEAAAQAGYGPAAYDLARLAEAGALSAGKPDKDQTVFYFKGAAESGLAVAQYRMGNYAATGEAGARDEKAALEWFKKGAEQTHRPSMLAAALLLDRAGDLKGATALLEGAANLDYAPAFNDLGVRYLQGKALPVDEKLAFALFRSAAIRGLAAAHINLGLCAENGRGLKKDADGAARSYLIAAKAGHPVGQFLAAEAAEKTGDRKSVV